jgi:hypothetical protein
MQTSRWFPKALVPCLLLTPALAHAQTLGELHVPSEGFEITSFADQGKKLQLDPPPAFATVKPSKCDDSDKFLARTSNSSFSLSSTSLVLPAKPFLGERATSTCGNIRRSFQPIQRMPRLPNSPCSPIAAIDASDGCTAQLNFLFPPWGIDSNSRFPDPILAVRSPKGKFHWKPALWQSFEFLVMEHAFRLASDSYARYLVFHKPFWHDYLSSANHFDMSRWGDGDSFLVNYIGHPLEGSVSGDIFIQNDPVGRSVRFGKSSAYWQSRFKAMAWAAVYSTYFEIGPVLSEAALGNEGGYTYVPGCGFYPTCTKEPGRKYKSPTNNTGWVDFVITPTVGMVWIILEDAIEAKLVDKMVKPRTAKHNLLLAGLTPSRTMANVLAGKHPWYRPVSESTTGAFGAMIQPVTSRPAWKDDPRWSLGLQFTELNLPMDWEGCSACRTFVPGGGFTFSYRMTRFVSVDSEFNLFPGSGKTSKTGGAQEVLAGLKVGHSFRSWGVFSQVRPGFIHYDKTLVPGSTTDYESTTRFALDLGGVVEYYASRHSTFRFNIGTTLVHYLTGHPDPNQPPVNVLSSDYYATQGNFRLSSGYIFKF